MNRETKELVRALQILLDLDMSTMTMIEENTPSVFIAPFTNYIYLALPWYTLYTDNNDNDNDNAKYPNCSCKYYYLHVILSLNSPHGMLFHKN